MRRLLLIVDADNTLWDTDSVFAKAQLALAGVLEAYGFPLPGDRLAFLRAVDRRLVEGAGRFEYNFEALPLALIIASQKGSPDFDLAELQVRPNQADDVRRVAAEAHHAFDQALKGSIPPLLPGVAELLNWLRDLRGRPDREVVALLVTEGDRERLERIAAHHGVDRDVFDHVHILPAKDAASIREVVQEGRELIGETALAVSIGDSLERDVVPAKAAGCITIQIPAGFHGHERPASNAERPDHQVDSMHEAVQIIASLLAGESAAPR